MNPCGVRLQADQFQVGKPLPFDIFDEAGSLLLRRGFVVADISQLLRLLERGLYRNTAFEDAHAAVAPVAATPVNGRFHRVPVFALIADVQRKLEILLADPAPGDFSARVLALVGELQRSFVLDADAAIASIQVLRDGRYAARRLIHGALLSELLLSQTGESEALRRVVMCAALTMNLSMLDLQDVLFAQATPASPQQKTEIKRHPTTGVQMLRDLGVSDQQWLALVGQHHETIDGRGYPLGLRAPAITRSAQLLSLADRYGALATGRGYRAAALPNTALRQIFMDKDKAVDAGLANLLVKAIGVYPPGSAVVLANGDYAVVVKRTQHVSHPVVRCVKTYRNEILEQPRKRLTSEPAHAIARMIPMADLGFTPEPHRLWDEGVEIQSGVAG